MVAGVGFRRAGQTEEARHSGFATGGLPSTCHQSAGEPGTATVISSEHWVDQ